MTIVIEGSKGTLAADDMHLIMNVVVNQSQRKSCFCCGKVILLPVTKNEHYFCGLHLRKLLLKQLAKKGSITQTICVFFKDVNKGSAPCLHFQISTYVAI